VPHRASGGEIARGVHRTAPHRTQRYSTPRPRAWRYVPSQTARPDGSCSPPRRACAMRHCVDPT
jgi:hypothetical protein